MKYYVKIGDKYNKWLVKEKLKNGYWRCECECGSVKNITASHLCRGKSKQCLTCLGKCLSKQRTVDLTGKKIHSWTVIKRTNNLSKHRRVVWECKCECGKIFPVSSSALLSNASKKCRYCNHYKDIQGTYWSNLKSQASRRNVIFNINIIYVWKLFEKQNKKCNISGLDISFKDHTASLDRIDSSIGYIEGNVQWVHKDINHMKYVFNQNYFINMCRIVANNNQ